MNTMQENSIFSLEEDNMLTFEQEENGDNIFDYFINSNEENTKEDDLFSDINIESEYPDPSLDIQLGNTPNSFSQDTQGQFTLSESNYHDVSTMSQLSMQTNENQFKKKQMKQQQQSRKRIYKKSIQKKRKKYEPITDNGHTYIYEDDKDEYMKARKRVQNRKSANRVRSRNKKYQQQVDEELRRLIKENGDLKIRNAQLSGENTRLISTVAFLENIVNNSNKISQEDKTKALDQPHLQSPLLPLTMPQHTPPLEINLEELSLQKDGKYMPNIATNNGKQYIYSCSKKPQNPSRHFVLFGIFTMLLFMFGMQTLDTSVTGQTLIDPGFVNTGGAQPLSLDNNSQLSQPENWEQQIKLLIKENQSYRFLKNIMWYGFILGYIAYTIFLSRRYFQWRTDCLKRFKYTMSQTLIGGIGFKSE